MFVDIWLGKEIDPNGLYNPKPSNNTMNENNTSNANLFSQTRPFAQSVRGNPAVVQPPPTTGTLKSTKSHVDNRRGKIKNRNFDISYPILFQLVLRKQVYLVLNSPFLML
jgi:hypothetical protein